MIYFHFYHFMGKFSKRQFDLIFLLIFPENTFMQIVS